MSNRDIIEKLNKIKDDANVLKSENEKFKNENEKFKSDVKNYNSQIQSLNESNEILTTQIQNKTKNFEVLSEKFNSLLSEYEKYKDDNIINTNKEKIKFTSSEHEKNNCYDELKELKQILEESNIIVEDITKILNPPDAVEETKTNDQIEEIIINPNTETITKGGNIKKSTKLNKKTSNPHVLNFLNNF